MVFGDNVRARRAARALPRTPAQREREEEERRGEEKRAEGKEERNQNPHTTHCTPRALLPNTNHHRYSTMTQPCHKDTTLNQQCRDREHKEGEGGKRETQPFTMRQHTLQCRAAQQRTPPHFPTHNKHDTTQTEEGARTTQEGQDNAKGRTQSKHRASQHTPLPPFNRATG